MKLQNTRGGRIVLQDIKVRLQRNPSVFGKQIRKVAEDVMICFVPLSETGAR